MDVISFRDATSNDAAALGALHVAAWRETYTGLLPCQLLDGLSVEARSAMWRAILCDPASHAGAVIFVAESEGTCPAGKLLKRRRRRFADRPDEVPADGFFRYRASMADCTACPLKPQCCPGQPMRKVMRSIHEGARDLARALTEEDEWLVSRKCSSRFAWTDRCLWRAGGK